MTRSWLIAIAVFIGCILASTPTFAGCYECGVTGICSEVEAGAAGRENCISYQICTNGCTTKCSTEGEDRCVGKDECICQDTQSRIIPNGDALDGVSFPVRKPVPPTGQAPA